MARRFSLELWRARMDYLGLGGEEINRLEKVWASKYDGAIVENGTMKDSLGIVHPSCPKWEIDDEEEKPQ